MTVTHLTAWRVIVYRSARNETTPRNCAYLLAASPGVGPDQTGDGRGVRPPGEGMDHRARIHEPAGGPPSEGAPAFRPRRTSWATTPALRRSSPGRPSSGKYYRALAAASKRVKVLPVGTTDEGRECLVVAIADEETIRNLDTYKGYLARLADPRGLSAGPGETDHRAGQADLHVHRRTALRRNRTARDADGTRVPSRRGGNAALRFHPQERDRDGHRRGRARWPRPLRRLVLQIQAQRRERERPHSRPALLGQVHLPRQQSRHQLLAGDDVATG